VKNKGIENMSNRVAIITGATRGIGYGSAEALMARGVSIATVYHQDEEASSRLKKAGEAGVYKIRREIFF
jgi:3-oxoacyl-[acyl-carrier protein] reductase